MWIHNCIATWEVVVHNASGRIWASRLGEREMSIRGKPGDPAKQMKIDANRGMTLVEVLVAVLILGMTLGAGVRALTANRRVVEAARRQTEAYHQARSVLETLTQRSFFEGSMSVGTHVLPGGGRYVVSLSPGNSSLKLVAVSIPWSGGDPGSGGAPRETLTTAISEALHP